MEDIVISIIENKELTYGVLFFFMLVYVFWNNKLLTERSHEREDKLLKHNEKLLDNNKEFIKQLEKMENTLERIMDIILLLKNDKELSDKFIDTKNLSKIKKINKFKISPHFYLNEFESPDTNEVKISPVLICKLEILRNFLNKPLIINSGYRTPEYNDTINGASESKHIDGIAADIKKVTGYSIEEMANYAKKAGFKGIGTYNWGIHVDTRENFTNWDSRRKELKQ